MPHLLPAGRSRPQMLVKAGIIGEKLRRLLTLGAPPAPPAPSPIPAPRFALQQTLTGPASLPACLRPAGAAAPLPMAEEAPSRAQSAGSRAQSPGKKEREKGAKGDDAGGKDKKEKGEKKKGKGQKGAKVRSPDPPTAHPSLTLARLAGRPLPQGGRTAPLTRPRLSCPPRQAKGPAASPQQEATVLNASYIAWKLCLLGHGALSPGASTFPRREVSCTTRPRGAACPFASRSDSGLSYRTTRRRRAREGCGGRGRKVRPCIRSLSGAVQHTASQRQRCQPPGRSAADRRAAPPACPPPQAAHRAPRREHRHGCVPLRHRRAPRGGEDLSSASSSRCPSAERTSPLYGASLRSAVSASASLPPSAPLPPQRR